MPSSAGVNDMAVHDMFDELCDTADEKLFDNVPTNDFHALHSLLPPASQNYSLRPQGRIQRGTWVNVPPRHGLKKNLAPELQTDDCFATGKSSK